MSAALILVMVGGVLPGGVAAAQAVGVAPAEYREPASEPSRRVSWPSSTPEAEEFAWAADGAAPVTAEPLTGTESAEVTVEPGGEPVRAGALPMTVAVPAGDAAGLQVAVEALPPMVAGRLSPFGVAVRLRTDAADASTTTARTATSDRVLSVGVDLSAVDLASGGEVVQRLALTRLTGCRDVARGGVDGVVCGGSVPLASQVDLASGRLTATVDEASPVEVRPVASDTALRVDAEAAADAVAAQIVVTDPASTSTPELSITDGIPQPRTGAPRDTTGSADPAADQPTADETAAAADPVVSGDGDATEAAVSAAASEVASEPAAEPSSAPTVAASEPATEASSESPAGTSGPSDASGVEAAPEAGGEPLDDPTVSEAPEGSAALEPTGGSTFSVLAVTSSASSSAGSYAAAPFSVVSDDEVGLYSGAAELTYDIPVPDAAAGPQPSLDLTYSSAAVDGMSTSTNNQPGSVGVGWALGLGSVRRIFEPCSNGRDTCSAGGEYSLTLNGVSSRLVHDGGGSYVVASDPRWRVTRKTASESAHSDVKGHYWEVVTPDGTTYLFGRQFEAETGVDQRSVQYLQLKNSSTCAGSAGDLCKAAWRWDLDRVEDTNGNVVSYFYAREFNEYRPYGLATPRQYVRAAHPVRIEYTKRAGASGGSQPNARVLFNHEVRCGGENKAGLCNWPGDFSDTPSDLWCRDDDDCASSTNPQTFFSQLRLAAVTTQVRDGGRWVSRGTWDLAQTFPDYAESGSVPAYEEPKLALYRVHRRPGGPYEHYAFSQLEAESADRRVGVSTTAVDPTDVASGGHVTKWHAGDYARFNDVWFGGGSGTPSKAVIWHQAVSGGGSVQLWIDGQDTASGGTKIAELAVTDTNGQWKAKAADIIGSVDGTHDLYVVTTSGVKSTLQVSWVSFRTNMSAVPSLRWTDFAASDTSSGFNDDFAWRPNRSDTGGGVSHMYLPRVKTVRNELGGESTFTYGQPAGCASGNWHLNTSHCYPEQVEYDDTSGVAIFRKWVVTRLTRDPVFGGAPDEVADFAYTAPAWRLTNRPDRDDQYRSDFRGHETVKVTDANGDYTQHRFFQGMDNDPDLAGTPRTFTKSMWTSSDTFADSNWLAGREFETLIKDASGARVHDTRITYHAARTGGPSGTPESDYAAWFTAPDKVVDVTKTGTDTTSQVRYSYDSYGNVTLERRDGDNTDPTDNRTIATEYTVNTGAWIVDTPRRETVHAGTDTSGAVAARTVWQYDGNNWTDPPDKGNLTVQRDYHTATDFVRTKFTNDAWGRPTAERVVQPGGLDAVSTATYDGVHGYVTATRDYIAADDTTLDTSPGDHVTATGYDDYARPATVTDVNGHTTTLGYDGYDRLTAVTVPGHGAGATQRFSYSTALPARTTSEQRIDDAAGGVYVAAYEWADGYGRSFQTQTAMPDADTRTVVTTRYDNLGRVRYASAPYELSGDPATGGGANGEVLPDWATVWAYDAYSYDAAGRVTTVNERHRDTIEATTTTSYSGWETRVTDPNGDRTDTLADAFGNTVRVEEFDGGAVDATTSYTYDPADRLVTVVDDAGNTTTVGYDLLGRKTAMDDADTGDWTYSYNDRGDLESQTDGRGQQLSFVYDGLGRTTATHAGTTADPVVAEWTWDAAGFKGLMASTTAHYGTDGTVQTRHPAYDEVGRPLRTETWIPTSVDQWDVYATEISYRPDGTPATLSYPGDTAGGLGETVTYGYHDRTGQPDTLTGADPYVTAAAYTGFGAPARVDHGATHDGLTRTWEYDTRNRLGRVTADTTSTSLVDTTVGYDPTGNVTQVVDHRNDGQATCHDYDHRSRLTRAYTQDAAGGCDGTHDPTVGVDGFDRAYTYDTIGNLTANSAVGELQYPTGGAGVARPHAVTAITDATGTVVGSFGYDDAGNTTSRQIDGRDQTLTYDHDNRLTAVTDGGQTTRLWYTADGARVRRATPTETTNYVGDLYEHDTTSGATTAWYRFDGTPVAYREDGTVRLVVGDHLGSTTAVYTPATDQIARQRYHPYGGLRTTDPGVTTDIGFTGQRADEATGLMYYQARYYDPVVGRFTQPDAIVPDPGNPQDLNRYSYVRNNPATHTDPTGNAVLEGNSAQGGKTVNMDGTPAVVQKDTPRPGANDLRAQAAAKTGKPSTSSSSSSIVGNVARGAGDSVVATLRGIRDTVKHPLQTLQGLAPCAANLIACGAMIGSQFADTCRLEGYAYCAGTLAPDLLAILATGGTAATLRGIRTARLTRTAARAPRGTASLVDDAAGGASRSPSFIAHPNGEIVPVPSGATGPTAARGNGFQFTGGSGGNGLDPRVTDIRIMDPVTTGKHPLPNGYVSYLNEAGQTVNPWTGQTIGRANPWWHWEWSGS